MKLSEQLLILDRAERVIRCREHKTLEEIASSENVSRSVISKIISKWWPDPSSSSSCVIASINEERNSLIEDAKKTLISFS